MEKKNLYLFTLIFALGVVVGFMLFIILQGYLFVMATIGFITVVIKISPWLIKFSKQLKTNIKD